MSFDTFMKFEGDLAVTGESTAAGYEGQIEIYSFSLGASNPVTIGSGSGGVSGGKVSISSFNCMKKTELSSAVLFSACCTGQHFSTVTITMRKAAGDASGQKPFLIYTFTNCMIESIQWSGSSGGDDTPTESVSIAFGAIKIDYSKQGAKKGDIKTGASATWDLTTVKK